MKPAYLELTKLRITALVVFTTATGLWLAPARPAFPRVILTLAGTALIVAAANVLNMFLERDMDALMPRTMRRPLPTGRVSPRGALRFGLVLSSPRSLAAGAKEQAFAEALISTTTLAFASGQLGSAAAVPDLRK